VRGRRFDRALGAAFAFALALFLRWPRENALVGDEIWTYLSVLDPGFFLFDFHPPLYSLAVAPAVLLGGREALLVLHAVLSSLAAPIGFLAFGPGAGLLLALWPSLVEAGGFARHSGVVATLLVAWAAALQGGRGVVPLAHLLALTHATSQAALLGSLLLRQARRVLPSLLANPLVLVEGFRALALAWAVLEGRQFPLVPNPWAFLDALLLPGPWALLGGALLAFGALRGPLFPFLLALFPFLLLAGGGRLSEAYAAPIAALLLLPAGRALGKFWPLALLLLPLSLQATEGLAAHRVEMRAEVAEAEAKGMAEVEELHYVLFYRANGYWGPIVVKACPGFGESRIMPP